MSRASFPSEETERRVQAALRGRSAEVLRVIAAQPIRATNAKHLVNPDLRIPVHRR